MPWRASHDGLELSVRLTPRGGRDGIDGIGDVGGRPVLRVRVAAPPPVENAANAALVAYLAAALGIGRSDVRLVAGQKARVKTLRLTGVGLADRLSALAAPGDRGDVT